MKKRNPILAFFLSFIFLGLGQMYNGQFKKGILILIAFIPIVAALTLMELFNSFVGYAIMFLFIVLYRIFAGVEAARTAKRQPEIELQKYNTPLAYIAFLLLATIITTEGARLIKNMSGYQSFSIASVNMEPSLKVGDYVSSTHINSAEYEFELGDLVAYTLPNNDLPFSKPGDLYIGRIMGLSGQSVQIKDFIVDYGDSKEEIQLTREVFDDNAGIGFSKAECASTLPNDEVIGIYKALDTTSAQARMHLADLEPIQIPEGHIYLLGDNRLNSYDSRSFGTISKMNIKAVIRYIFWSKSLSRIGLRLE